MQVIEKNWFSSKAHRGDLHTGTYQAATSLMYSSFSSFLFSFLKAKDNKCCLVRMIVLPNADLAQEFAIIALKEANGKYSSTHLSPYGIVFKLLWHVLEV